MATTFLAMWLQESDAASNRHLIFILVLIIALAIAGMAIILVVFSLKALKAVKEIMTAADEVKAKLVPLIDEVTVIARSSRHMLEEATPKIKSISENLVKASDAIAEGTLVARNSLQRLEVTVTDANFRTQKQVARVDGMVTAVLDTTAEIVENVNHGIRVPLRRVAEMAAQAKYSAEGILARIKGMAAASPFARKPDPDPGPPRY